MEELTGG